jgi:hypothetical protein
VEGVMGGRFVAAGGTGGMVLVGGVVGEVFDCCCEQPLKHPTQTTPASKADKASFFIQ